MENKYNHQEVEKKIQEKWREMNLNKTSDNLNGKKLYVLDMFPYPSGDGLHVGHPKGYIASDIHSRMKKMQGFSILHPMGFDAFGLPAENYAIKNKIHPRIAVEKNVKRFKEQLEQIGFNYDWEREINTTDPEYYKWTQWTFLKMLEKGLAFESFEPINWCPSCQTGLANEDLDDGLCERCGSVVEKRSMRQWVLKITDYAERLLSDLDELNWPEHIKESQRNWIGKSEGTEVGFEVASNQQPESREKIEVFTTRVDTLFGVTYLVIAPEYGQIKEWKEGGLIQNWSEVEKYINESRNRTEIERTSEGKEKTGVEIKDIKAVNPANGEEVPVFVADYVLGNYGTGAVMAVPAHDDRDFAFAQKYDLPIKEVIIPKVIDYSHPPKEGEKTVERKAIHAIIVDPKTQKILTLRWNKFPWTTFVTGGVEGDEDVIEAARREILEETGYSDLKYIKTLGGPVECHFYAEHKKENRKAYFSTIVFELQSNKREEVSEAEKNTHDISWVSWEEFKSDKNLTCAEFSIWDDRFTNPPHAFTEEGTLMNSGKFDGLTSEEAREKITEKFGQKVIKYKLRDWVFSRQRYWGEPIPVVHCQTCGSVAVPEGDLPVTLPEVEHYEPTGTGESPLANIDEWVNTTCPKCGGPAKRETNTMPQWAGSSWYYLRYIDPKNDKALVDKEKEKYWSPVDMYVGGAEHATRHLIYARFWHKFLFDIGIVNYKEPFSRFQNVGLILAQDGKKMSKRFGNVINPDDIVKTWGADSLRLYEMFMGPFADSIAWNTDNMIGVRRFLERIWRFSLKEKKSGAAEDPKIESLLHKTIKKVTEDIENYKFNTAISAMMVMLNEIEKTEVSEETFRAFVKMLAPFAPHMAEEIWANLSPKAGAEKASIHLEPWPEFDLSKIKEESVTIMIQINGKIRAQFEAPAGLSELEAKEKALSLPETAKWLGGQEPKKVIFIANKIINFVV